MEPEMIVVCSLLASFMFVLGASILMNIMKDRRLGVAERYVALKNHMATLVARNEELEACLRWTQPTLELVSVHPTVTVDAISPTAVFKLNDVSFEHIIDDERLPVLTAAKFDIVPSRLDRVSLIPGPSGWRLVTEPTTKEKDSE